MQPVAKTDLQIVHQRISEMKRRIWWVVGLAVPILLAGAGWALQVGWIADANQTALRQQRTAINWIGKSVETIARSQEIELDPRPVLPEGD